MLRGESGWLIKGLSGHVRIIYKEGKIWDEWELLCD